MELPERPTTIHTQEDLAPKGPWSFLKEALAGGFTRWGWGLMAGWWIIASLTSFFWARHLQRHTAWSPLPQHWGERLSTRDLWELWENAGLKHEPIGVFSALVFFTGLLLVLWCGWRMQVERVGLRPRLGPWCMGLLDTALIGLIPLALVWGLLRFTLDFLGNLGIEGLAWMAFWGKPLLGFAFASALNLQWWLCRLNRLGAPWPAYAEHLRVSFLRLWNHPVQWSLLLVSGAALRGGLQGLVLLAAWRMGGSSTSRLLFFGLLQLLVTGINAWLLGYLLRITALFWKQDQRVCEARAALYQTLRNAHEP